MQLTSTGKHAIDITTLTSFSREEAEGEEGEKEANVRIVLVRTYI